VQDEDCWQYLPEKPEVQEQAESAHLPWSEQVVESQNPQLDLHVSAAAGDEVPQSAAEPVVPSEAVHDTVRVRVLPQVLLQVDHALTSHQ